MARAHRGARRSLNSGSSLYRASDGWPAWLAKGETPARRRHACM